MIDLTQSRSNAFLAKRYAKEKRFKLYGALALVLTTAFLAFLLVDIVSKGLPAFTEHHTNLEVIIDPAKIDATNLQASDYEGLLKDAIRAQFPDMTSRADKKKLNSVLSQGAANDLRNQIIASPSLIGQTITVSALLSDESDLYFKGLAPAKDPAVLEKVKEKLGITKSFAWRFFTNGDSREPELAGLWGALVGSLLTVAVALGLGQTSLRSTSIILQPSPQSSSDCWG
jgi:phosphate transport system permease protein